MSPTRERFYRPGQPCWCGHVAHAAGAKLADDPGRCIQAEFTRGMDTCSCEEYRPVTVPRDWKDPFERLIQKLRTIAEEDRAKEVPWAPYVPHKPKATEVAPGGL